VRILVAGVGNIFLGDDGFGVEVAQRMTRRAQPAGVTVIDFGIRSYDLSMRLAEPWDAVIVVDAMQRGESPGTVYVVTPSVPAVPRSTPEARDAHALDATSVLAWIGEHPHARLVACEPASLDPDLGLSPAVTSAIEPAIAAIDRLVAEVLAHA
jgi:hydrogenase maturation protease